MELLGELWKEFMEEFRNEMDEYRKENLEEFRKELLKIITQRIPEGFLEKLRKTLLAESQMEPFYAPQKKNFLKDPHETSEGVLNKRLGESLKELSGNPGASYRNPGINIWRNYGWNSCRSPS